MILKLCIDFDRFSINSLILIYERDQWGKIFAYNNINI